jgi:hypothetical protein
LIPHHILTKSDYPITKGGTDHAHHITLISVSSKDKVQVIITGKLYRNVFCVIVLRIFLRFFEAEGKDFLGRESFSLGFFAGY